MKRAETEIGRADRPANLNLTARDIQVLEWLREVRIATSPAMRAAYSHFGGAEMDQRRFSRRVIKLERSAAIGSALITMAVSTRCTGRLNAGIG